MEIAIFILCFIAALFVICLWKIYDALEEFDNRLAEFEDAEYEIVTEVTEDHYYFIDDAFFGGV